MSVHKAGKASSLQVGDRQSRTTYQLRYELKKDLTGRLDRNGDFLCRMMFGATRDDAAVDAVAPRCIFPIRG